MIIETTPKRPHLPRNYYRRERRGNPITTAFGIAAVLYFGWHAVRMGTAPIRPNLAASTTAFDLGVGRPQGAADSRPGSLGVESRVTVLAGDRE